MARTLETMTSGTPVFCGEVRIGAVSGVYTEGQARSVELVVVDWDGRGDVAVPVTEVETVDERGLVLLHGDPHFYDDLLNFSEERYPTVHKLG